MPEDFLTKGVASIAVLVIAAFLFMFWIYMVADCLERNFNKRAHKLLWLSLIVLLQTMGAFIYWQVVRRKA